MRLYAIACCRRLTHRCSNLLADALAEAETLADQPTSGKGNAFRVSRAALRWGARDELGLVDALAERDPFRSAQLASDNVIAAVTARNSSSWEERWFQAQCLHDLVGNPFRSTSFTAAWRTETVQLVAKQMYETHEFSGMPVLADALQEAGCDSADILDHCRDMSQAHVRGCWVVDLVLGKN
ncbi:hypothetical protein [Frigoriglobus tundricola]|uniref:hypothetical protein n=1 Tax=Frigoriglobus tundricola TaxID=2774151 RepID=UPI001D07DB03|nr:hypothetical protein [Frigoriglobus tundricola]